MSIDWFKMTEDGVGDAHGKAYEPKKSKQTHTHTQVCRADMLNYILDLVLAKRQGPHNTKVLKSQAVLERNQPKNNETHSSTVQCHQEAGESAFRHDVSLTLLIRGNHYSLRANYHRT